MERIRYYLQAVLILLALYGGLALVTGRARAQGDDCVSVALCSDRRTPYFQVVERKIIDQSSNPLFTFNLQLPAGRRAVIENASLWAGALRSPYRIRTAYLRVNNAAFFPITPVTYGNEFTSPPITYVFAQTRTLIPVKSGDHLSLSIHHGAQPSAVNVDVVLTLTGYLADR